MGGNQIELTSANETHKLSLGELLITARERRGLSREMVVQRTHIPAQYVQMLEDDDYHRISDQLYLLPFLRKYASFLEIDQHESAMRLLREVQRVDNSPPTIRLDERLDDSRRSRRRNWTKPIMFGALVAVIIGAYFVQSHHNDMDTIAPAKVQSSQVLTPSSTFASEDTSSVRPGQPAQVR